MRKGFGKYYTKGPGPRWGEGDRRNVEAFQRAQGWRGGAADGYPGSGDLATALLLRGF